MAADARAISRHVSDPRLRIVPVGVGAPTRARRGAELLPRDRAGRSVAIEPGVGHLEPPAAPARPRGPRRPRDHATCTRPLRRPDGAARLHGVGPRAGRVLTVHGPPGLRERLMAFSGSEAGTGLRLPRAGAGEGEITSATASSCATARCAPAAHPRRARRARGAGDLLLRRLRAQRGAGRARARMRGAGVRVLVRAERVPEGVRTSTRATPAHRRPRRRRAPAAGALLARVRPRGRPRGGA